MMPDVKSLNSYDSFGYGIIEKKIVYKFGKTHGA